MPPERNQRRRPQPPNLPANEMLLVVPLIIVVFVTLWFVFWDLERINLAGLPFLQGFPGPFVFIVELIYPGVLRHFIPLVLGWLLAYTVAVKLVLHLYDLPDRPAARDLLRRLRAPRSFIQSPLSLTPQTLEAERPQHVRLRVGGPGYVRLGNGRVAVTELNGRFYRILPPGTHALGRLEYVRNVLDLRPQERSAEDVTLRTLDGLEITTDISVTYRISTGDEPVTRANPYPFDPEAVRTLAYTETVSGPGKVSNWEGAALGTARGILTKSVGEFRLDELLYSHNTEMEPHLTLRNKVEREARAALRDKGIELLRVRIGRLATPDAITHQVIDYWRAFWETQAHITRHDGTAYAIEEMEIARAEAELTMIQAIVEGVQRSQREGRTSTMSQLVALRLIEALEKLARQSADAYPLPDHLLPRLNQLRTQIDSDAAQPPALQAPDATAVSQPPTPSPSPENNRS